MGLCLGLAKFGGEQESCGSPHCLHLVAGRGAWGWGSASLLLPRWGYLQWFVPAGHLAWHVFDGCRGRKLGHLVSFGPRLFSEDLCLFWLHPGWWPVSTVELQ